MANPQIKIELIRDIEHQMIYRPLIGDRKICLIDDADRMTIGAANALLKTLEEPPDHSLFMLISSRPYALPGHDPLPLPGPATHGTGTNPGRSRSHSETGTASRRCAFSGPAQ